MKKRSKIKVFNISLFGFPPNGGAVANALDKTLQETETIGEKSRYTYIFSSLVQDWHTKINNNVNKSITKNVDYLLVRDSFRINVAVTIFINAMVNINILFSIIKNIENR